MATEIFMSCTCTSVVRGTASGPLFLPLPHLPAEAFQEIPPTRAQPHCVLSPAQGPQGAPPILADSAHVGPRLPLVPTVAPVLPCPCPFLRAEWDMLGCGSLPDALCPH